MTNRVFSLDKNKKYILYGAGGNTYHIIPLLNENGCEVKYIIDKRAEEIKEILSVPVIAYEDIPNYKICNENFVVIITIKNVFEHINVVRLLLKLGFQNIIYKPYGILQGENDTEWNSINNIYEELISKRKWPCEEKLKEIFKTRDNHLISYRNELLIGKDADNSCIYTFLPVELVLNYEREDAYGLVPMVGYYPLLNIYEWLICGRAYDNKEQIKYDLELYAGDWLIRTKQILTEKLSKNMFISRIDVFYEMQRKYDLDRDFFVRNLVRVKRNDFGLFFLESSGRNRVSYMIAKGQKYVPVIMSIDDYKLWMNENVCEEIKNMLENQGITELYSPIPHPYLSGYQVRNLEYIRLWCSPIIKDIIHKLHYKSRIIKDNVETIDYRSWLEAKNSYRILIAMEDEGCLGRLLCMYGFNVTRYSNNKRDKEIALKIDKLLIHDKNLMNDLSYIDAVENSNTYDFIVCDNKSSDQIQLDSMREGYYYSEVPLTDSIFSKNTTDISITYEGNIRGKDIIGLKISPKEKKYSE